MESENLRVFKWKRKSFFNYDLESKEIIVPIKKEEPKKRKHRKKSKLDDEFGNFRNCSSMESFAFNSFDRPDKSDKIKKLLGFKVKRSGNKSSTVNNNSFAQKASFNTKVVNSYNRLHSLLRQPSNVVKSNILNTSNVTANNTKSASHSVEPNSDSPSEKNKEDKKISLKNVSKAKGLAAFGKVNKKYINADGDFACTICPYVSKYTTRFEIHMKQTHPEVSIFRCGICEYETRSKSYLTVHMMNHFGLKPFKCTQCDYASPRKDYLHLHMRSHSKIHSFSCSLCKYTTYRKDYLHRHKAEKHPKISLENVHVNFIN